MRARYDPRLMAAYDFDFQRYVARRKGARAAEQREGAAYAYAGDLRVRRVLARLRPVTLALEQAARLWQATARAELLATAVRANEREFPRVMTALGRAARALHVEPPPLYVTPHVELTAHSFGTDEAPQLLLHAELTETLGDAELLHVLGAELGHVQNDHVLLGTALHYLRRAPGGFLRWIVRPAVGALSGWERRAAITADRAGLLASRDLAASKAVISKLAERSTSGPPRSDEASAETLRRVGALEVFAQGAYYRGVVAPPGEQAGGLDADEVDARVAHILKDTGAA